MNRKTSLLILTSILGIGLLWAATNHLSETDVLSESDEKVAQENIEKIEKAAKNMDYLPAIEIEPKEKADAAIIWLHGLGADGHDFVPIVPELNLPESLNIRFIFPHAPSIPITINGGMVMPGWYDIKAMSINREVDSQQLFSSAAAVQALIEREIERGVKSDRIILIGFSQGGAVNYHAALTYPKPLAGLAALSTYFATSHLTEINKANENIPILIAHGRLDPMVPEMLGKQAFEFLENKGFKPEYKNYPIEHAVNLEEIQDISTWIQNVLNSNKP